MKQYATMQNSTVHNLHINTNTPRSAFEHITLQLKTEQDTVMVYIRGIPAAGSMLHLPQIHSRDDMCKRLP